MPRIKGPANFQASMLNRKRLTVTRTKLSFTLGCDVLSHCSSIAFDKVSSQIATDRH